MNEAYSSKRLWLVRLGKHGEREAKALEENILSIGFGISHDISHLQDRDALIAEMAKLFPEDKINRHKNFAAQINQFVNVAQVGDLVVTPFKTNSTIAIGLISGPYKPGPNGEVQRSVQWLKTDLPRDTFRQDLLYSFGAFMTVCEITRNNALERVKAVLAGAKDPGDGSAPSMPGKVTNGGIEEPDQTSDQPVDLNQIARDQIEKRIASVFVGHEFTNLVAAILSAQGYKTRVSPPGPDNGVDIVAGSGPLGLESPRIVVQVKSGNVVVDQQTLQSLIGSTQDTQANYGLIVSWGGYTNAVRKRINELFFRVRLWGRDEIVDNLLTHYDQLPEDIRAELPLKRTWTLVLEDTEELS